MIENENKQEIENELKVSMTSTIGHLKAKINNEKSFKKEVQSIVDYYGSKFVNVQKSEEDRNTAAELIEDIIVSQIAHGYFLVANELAEDKIEDDRPKTFEKEFWDMSPGLMRNSAGIVARQLFGDNWFMGIGIESVNLRVLQALQHSFNLYLTILEETAMYGAFLAISEDENYKKEEENHDLGEVLLGNPLDIHFLNPQVYMQYGFYSNQHESWELFLGNSSSRQEKWIGSIHLSIIPEISTAEKKEDSYYLNIMLEDVIMEHEKSYICKEVIKRLPEKIQNTVQFRVYHLARTPEIYEAKKFLNY